MAAPTRVSPENVAQLPCGKRAPQARPLATEPTGLASRVPVRLFLGANLRSRAKGQRDDESVAQRSSTDLVSRGPKGLAGAPRPALHSAEPLRRASRGARRHPSSTVRSLWGRHSPRSKTPRKKPRTPDFRRRELGQRSRFARGCRLPGPRQRRMRSEHSNRLLRSRRCPDRRTLNDSPCALRNRSTS